ncbi:MAG: DNA alkylation repair protein [Gemmatimonadota bacterium]
MEDVRGPASALVDEIRRRVSLAQERSVPVLRRVRRELTMRMEREDPAVVTQVVKRAIAEPSVPRWLAYELLHYHQPTMDALTIDQLEDLGKGIGAWAEVDSFACYISGPAWREGRVSTIDIRRWALSNDRWWRRAALVSTVALNNTARGGIGDADRTFAICDLLRDDRDDMVVKAMSWALRELLGKEPRRVEAYVARHERVLAARIVREVRNKLETGLKNPNYRRAAAAGRTSTAALADPPTPPADA